MKNQTAALCADLNGFHTYFIFMHAWTLDLPLEYFVFIPNIIFCT